MVFIMKVTLKNGFEDLSGYSYNYKRDVFRRKNLYYKFKIKCKVCGSAYFMRTTYPTRVCSAKCSNKLDTVRTKISNSLTGYKRSKNECLIISKRMSKGGVTKKNLPLFNTYAYQLLNIEQVRQKGNLLEVRCTLCTKWFVPKRTNVDARAQFIKGNTDREARFYCSNRCKENCPIFKKKKYPSGKNPRKYRNKEYVYTSNELRIWSKEVLKRAGYICEICGKEALLAHHEQPKKLRPFYALDPDNGIACCKKCHYKYCHSGPCSTIRLASIKCI